jgi:hypothetical protein
MTKTILSFLLLGLLTSCAIHTGNISTGPVIDCPYRHTVTGTARVIQPLGLGGVDRDALIKEAKQDLYSKHPYNKDIKLSNFAADYKYSNFLLISATKVTVSADLFDCSPTATSGLNVENIEGPSTIGGLTKGDSIIYDEKGYHKGVFSNYLNSGNYEIQYITKSKKMRTAKVSPSLVFKTTRDDSNMRYFGFNVGETAFIEVEKLKTNIKTKKSCMILGLNVTSVIISYVKDDGTSRMVTVGKSALKK